MKRIFLIPGVLALALTVNGAFATQQIADMGPNGSKAATQAANEANDTELYAGGAALVCIDGQIKKKVLGVWACAEDGGTMSDAEVKTAYENNLDTNAFTDAEKSNLANQSGTNTGDNVNFAAPLGLDDNYVTDAEKVIIGNTSGTNSGDMSNANVKTAYEANLDTNSFDDAEQSKLLGIEVLADVTDATNVSAAGAPIISEGVGAPVSTPSKVGDVYIDTTNDNSYTATGTVSSADWVQTDAADGGVSERTDILSTGETVGKVLQADGDNTSSWVALPGGGDMLKATYDTGLNGIVDDSDASITHRALVTGNPHGVNAADTVYDGTETVEQVLDDTLNSGILGSLVVTDEGGLNISWPAGTLFDSVTSSVVNIDAQVIPVACTDGSAMNYLKWISGSTLTLNTTFPVNGEIIIAGIPTQNGDILDIIPAPKLAERESFLAAASNKLFAAVVPPNGGMLITEDEDPTNVWDVSLSTGEYFLFGQIANTVSASDSRTVTMVRWYKTAGVWTSDTHAEVIHTQWNNGTDLTAVTSNKYYRSNFSVVGSTIHFIVADTEYDTVADAIAGVCPTRPPGLQGFPRSTCMVLRGSATAFPAVGSDQWLDVRPVIGATPEGSVSSHSNLSTLGWSSSGHSGANNTIATFGAGGEAVESATIAATVVSTTPATTGLIAETVEAGLAELNANKAPLLNAALTGTTTAETITATGVVTGSSFVSNGVDGEHGLVLTNNTLANTGAAGELSVNLTFLEYFDTTWRKVLLDSAIGVSVQAYDATYVVDADIGSTVQAYDATYVVDADIGVNVQAYDATTVLDADIVSANTNLWDHTHSDLTAVEADIKAFMVPTNVDWTSLAAECNGTTDARFQPYVIGTRYGVYAAVVNSVPFDATVAEPVMTTWTDLAAGDFVKLVITTAHTTGTATECGFAFTLTNT